MSYFNYRVVCKKEPINDMTIPIEYENTYSIYEVFYSDDGDIIYISDEPYDVMRYNESVNEMVESVKKLETALQKSVLNYEDVVSTINSNGLDKDW